MVFGRTPQTTRLTHTLSNPESEPFADSHCSRPSTSSMFMLPMPPSSSGAPTERGRARLNWRRMASLHLRQMAPMSSLPPMATPTPFSRGSDSGAGNELWRTDGTLENTRKVDGIAQLTYNPYLYHAVTQEHALFSDAAHALKFVSAMDLSFCNVFPPSLAGTPLRVLEPRARRVLFHPVYG